MNRNIEEQIPSVAQVASRLRVSLVERLSPLWQNRVLALVVINVVFALGAGLYKPAFLRPANLWVIFVEMAMAAILLGPGVMILTSGMFDISIDGVVVLAAIVGAKLMRAANWDPLPAVLGAVAVGTSIGLINGWFTNKVKVNPLIITLATWWICLGLAYGITSGVAPYGFPQSFRVIGTKYIGGVPIFVWYAIISVVLFWFLMEKTRFGYQLYAMGGNRRAAELHGIKVDRIGITVYVTLAFVGSLIGLIYIARLDSAPPILVQGLALNVISACVIGGTSVGGGKGSIMGALLGMLLMNMLMNATVVLGMNPYWQRAILGVVLFLAVVVDWFNNSAGAEAGMGKIGA